MKTITQIAVLAVLGGAGAGWHFYGEQFGLRPPLEMIGLQSGSGPRSGGGGAGRSF